MSSGSSRRSQPRPGIELHDETPRSASAPSTLAMPRASSTASSPGSRYGQIDRRPQAASAAAACRSASGRDRPEHASRPLRSAACPPNLTVQSTNNLLRAAQERERVPATRTGSCVDIATAGGGQRLTNPAGIGWQRHGADSSRSRRELGAGGWELTHVCPGYQIPNSESARASSSVKGSRCSLAMRRSWFQMSR